MSLLCALAFLRCGGERVVLPDTPDSPDTALLPDGDEAPIQLSLSPDNPQIAAGTAQQFALRGLYVDGRIRDLTRAVAWRITSEDGRGVTMPQSGALQLDIPGRYVITARHAQGQLSTTLSVTDAAVVGVAISPSAPRVPKGLTRAFTATAQFSDGTTQDVTAMATWAVRDLSGVGVASIDTTGVLLAKNVGRATITTRYSGFSASTTAEVLAATLNSLSVSPAAPTIAAGTSQRFTATGVYSDGTSMDVTSLATWAVTDVVGTRVASIDGSGTALGLRVGEAQVSADYASLSAQTSLFVTIAVPVSISLSPATASIAKGTTQQYKATAQLSDGSTQDVTTAAAWTATDRTGTGVASIDAGLAKGNTLGSATIGCSYRGHSATAVLTVTAAVLTGINVSPASSKVFKGQYTTLAAYGVYSDGSRQDLSAVATWSAADLSGSDVASVAAGGRVFGKNLGKSTITATFNALSGGAVVEVVTPVYTAVSVGPRDAFTIRGFTLQFTATATLADGSTQNVTTLATWSISDFIGTGVATIDLKGLATGRATGVANVKAVFGGFTGSTTLLVF